ncbi:MAG TPA: tetratricopeptide repeat protein [Bacteroidaceae bacterium]|nr:tetratricopeptide repeat protein [Bacteroidaceae bacterium]
MVKYLPHILLAISLVLTAGSCTHTNMDGKMPITTGSDQAMEYYKTAITALEQIRYADAIDNFTRAIEEDPDFFMAYYWLYPLSGKNSKKIAESAFQIDAELSDAEENLRTAFKYLADGQKEKAVEQVEKIIELYPGDVETYKILYLLQFQFFKDMDKARRTVEKALKVNPDHAISYNMLGYALMELGDFENAEKAFEKYIKLEPDIANPYDSKGDFLMQTNKYREAYESYMKAYEIDTSFTMSLKKAMKAKKLSEEHESV